MKKRGILNNSWSVSNILLEFIIENTVSKGSKPESHEVLSLLSVCFQK